MATPASTSAPRSVPHGSPRHAFRPGRKTIIFLIVLAALICLAAVFYVKFWPFSREAVLQDLREATDSTVTAQAYHPTY
ncbi:MAG TPA: hypothetical protein VJQ54_20320, partial [Candidatus Sulfotelmatobacter sp.]|nr:hypothetical protein [Candidatus Sulfotelmatobacter sp.]